MRYALRNQEKIAAVYSNDYLQQHIIASLKYAFENTPTEVFEEALTVEYQTINGKNYQIIRVNDLADNDAMLEFAVVGRQYDVLKLAFIGRIKG